MLYTTSLSLLLVVTLYIPGDVKLDNFDKFSNDALRFEFVKRNISLNSEFFEENELDYFKIQIKEPQPIAKLLQKHATSVCIIDSPECQSLTQFIYKLYELFENVDSDWLAVVSLYSLVNSFPDGYTRNYFIHNGNDLENWRRTSKSKDIAYIINAIVADNGVIPPAKFQPLIEKEFKEGDYLLK